MIRFRINLIAVIVLMCFTMSMKAQIKVTSKTDVMLTQNWAMPTLLNPAATGDTDFIRIRGGARLDYFGSHQSPKNFLATGDSPFKVLGKRIGAGLVVNSGSYDLFRNLLISAQGSYKLKLKNSTLSIGLQIGYYHTKFKGSEFIIYNNTGGGTTGGGTTEEGTEGEEGDGNEPGDDDGYDLSEYPTQDVGAGAFDLGLGLRFEHPWFYVGASVQHLTNPTMKLSKEGEEVSSTRYMESKLPMSFYFDAGGNINFNNTLFTLQPSVLIGTDFSDFDAVIDMRATYNQKITFGVDYRWNRAAGVMAGLSIKNFFIGYSWEYDYSTKPKGSTGNHELVIGYQFKMKMGGKNMFSHRSIRIM